MPKYQNIIFLMPYKYSNFEAEKWQFDYLKAEHLNVININLGNILFSNSQLEKNNEQEDNYYSPKSYNEFNLLVESFALDSIFVDFLVGISPLKWSSQKVFRILRKNNADYMVILSGALPIHETLTKNFTFRSRVMLNYFFEALKFPKKILYRVADLFIAALVRHTHYFQKPKFIFGGHTVIMDKYLKLHNLSRDSVILANSFEYSKCLKFNDNHIKTKKNICVFLDEAATHHPDFNLLNKSAPDEQIYYNQMNSFFDFIESETELEVIIAAHPRSNYIFKEKKFSNRKIIKNQTLNLVASSKLVIAHLSTSISFAVFFEKPIVFLQIPGLPIDSGMNLMVETISHSLGKWPINLSDKKYRIDPSFFKCNVNLYQDYLNHYLRNNSDHKQAAWETIVSSIKKINV